jgi:FkbM family methyltransferase
MNLALKRVARLYFRARGQCSTQIRTERFFTDPYHVGFWRNVSRGRWEPKTYEILESILSPTAVYFDIGSWIGPTVLFAARRSRLVFAFEPDVVAFQYLLWNLRLNSLRNVRPFNIALTSKDADVPMSSFGTEPGDSMTSVLNPSRESDGLVALGLTFNSWMKWVQPPRADVIKIDIEGGEFDLLPTMEGYLKQNRPTLLLSTHAPYLPAGDREPGLRELHRLLSFYEYCYDEDMRRVGAETLNEQDTLTGFRSFLFSARPVRAQ